MKITVEPTSQVTIIPGTDQARYRVWKGTTDKGVDVRLLVAMVRVPAEADNTEFERELLEVLPQQVQLVDFRKIV